MPDRTDDMSKDELERFEEEEVQGRSGERLDLPASEAEQIDSEHKRPGPKPVVPMNPD
jgi:hypothetical protein